MDFLSQNEDSEYSPPLSPLGSALEELGDDLVNLAENDFAFTLPAYDIGASDIHVPRHLSIEQDFSSTASLPPVPRAQPTPNIWRPSLPNRTSAPASTNPPNPMHSTFIHYPSTTNPNPNINANATWNSSPSRRRARRTQALITRPAERQARNDLESLIPLHLRHQVGGGHGNANHAVFRGAAQYIRWLEQRVRELEMREPEEESEGESEGESEREAEGEAEQEDTGEEDGRPNRERA